MTFPSASEFTLDALGITRSGGRMVPRPVRSSGLFVSWRIPGRWPRGPLGGGSGVLAAEVGGADHVAHDVGGAVVGDPAVDEQGAGVGHR